MRTCRFLLVALAVFADAAHGEWRTIAPGLEIGTFAATQKSYIGKASITLVRIDPEHWDLEVVGLGWPGVTESRTAKQWCEAHGFVAAINAGMFGQDRETHLGYLQSGGHVNNGHVNRYRSVAAFDPTEDGARPAFRIFDLDTPGVVMKDILRDYASVVQNLRLIKRPGANRWGPNQKSWNEAALGEDSTGRVLFIYTGSPFTMYDLNNELLALDIGIVAAQHLDGGPVAQLYLQIGDVELDWVGGHPAAVGNPLRVGDMPIPHVIGIRPKPPASGSQ